MLKRDYRASLLAGIQADGFGGFIAQWVVRLLCTYGFFSRAVITPKSMMVSYRFLFQLTNNGHRS